MKYAQRKSEVAYLWIRVFENVEKLLTGRMIPIGMTKTFAKCFPWSVVSYVSETWAIKKKGGRYLDLVTKND